MRHEMLTQRAPFCIDVMAKKGTLSQHFVTCRTFSGHYQKFQGGLDTRHNALFTCPISAI